MALSETDLQTIAGFRDWFEQRASATGSYGPASRHDRPDHSMLLTRFEAGAHVWLEIGLRPFVPQLRAAIVTDDRWKSEELEEAIESTGDTMSEFIEAGFDEMDLDWRDPIVEHYRDAGKFFYFATPLELTALADLSTAQIREKAFKMLEGYRVAFGPTLVKPS